MSGLAAILHRDGRPVDPSGLSAMLAAVPYRGPDGMSIRLFGTSGLGYAKMAVTPEEEDEQQPLVSPRTGCAIIADVRLDNRGELLAHLPASPDPRVSDTNLVLRAYETWGVESPKRLLGDFAFVIWDPRSRKVVCARDTSGQRSLFYRIEHNLFAAASEIHQLLQDPMVPMVPNEARIRDYLTPQNVYRVEKDQVTTFFDGIWSIPAGSILIIDRDTLRVKRFWELVPPREIYYQSDDEYAEHFNDLFFSAVEARLRTSRPLGALLSGGLDSSSVVCAAQELICRGEVSDPGFISISLTFGDHNCDESHFIQEITAKYGFDARFVPAGEFANRLQLEPSGFCQSPLGGRTERNTAWQVASRAGIRAVLTGDVADSIVGGSGLVFDSLIRQRRLSEFRQYLNVYRRVTGESLSKIGIVYCLSPFLPLGLHRALMVQVALRQVKRVGSDLLPRWMPEPLRAELTSMHLQLRLENERRRCFANQTRHGDYLALWPPGITTYPTGLPVQSWQPFADRRLHEYLLAIPPEQRFRPHPDTDEFYAGSKHVLRRAMRGILPDNIRMRTSKTIFTSLFETEIRQNWHHFEAAFGPSSTSEVATRGYIDQRRFWQRLLSLRDGTRGPDLFYVRSIVLLESWLRIFRLPRTDSVTFPIQWHQRSKTARISVDSQHELVE